MQGAKDDILGNSSGLRWKENNGGNIHNIILVSNSRERRHREREEIHR